jgi:hypothetical protein
MAALRHQPSGPMFKVGYMVDPHVDNSPPQR